MLCTVPNWLHVTFETPANSIDDDAADVAWPAEAGSGPVIYVHFLGAHHQFGVNLQFIFH